MTEISINKNIYLYGMYYDTDRVKIPTDEQNWNLIIYVNSKREKNRIINSLEGYFVSDNNFLSSEFPNNNPVCTRNQMKEFEERYQGKFIPFEK
jgi:hypothetical protein